MRFALNPVVFGYPYTTGVAPISQIAIRLLKRPRKGLRPEFGAELVPREPIADDPEICIGEVRLLNRWIRKRAHRVQDAAYSRFLVVRHGSVVLRALVY